MKDAGRRSQEEGNQDDPWAQDKVHKKPSQKEAAINKPKVNKQSTDDKFNNFLDNEIKDLGLDQDPDADSSTVA